MGTQFTDLCLITADVMGLRAFYEAIFGGSSQGDGVHATLYAAGMHFTFDGVAELQESPAFGYVSAGGGNNIILCFSVDDVDATYARLLPLGARMLNQPTTHPWGARSFQCKDPDGNILNFRSVIREG